MTLAINKSPINLKNNEGGIRVELGDIFIKQKLSHVLG